MKAAAVAAASFAGLEASRRKVRLLIAYDGTDYSGWQRQRRAPSIQAEIENRLTTMTATRVDLHGAGRTDAGVHAEGMVAHFQTSATISCAAFQRGLNAMLPGSIRINRVDEADSSFHARFSAIGKEYRYLIYCGPVLPPQLHRYSLQVTAALDLPAIRHCLQLLPGSHDFSSFENSGSRDKSINSGRGAVRTIHRAELLPAESEQFFFSFIGDGFLRNMVRNLVGTLLEVGRGKFSGKDFAAILAAKDRKMAGPTAPPQGLFLKRVLY